MAFKASNILPADAYLTVKRVAVQLKINLQGFNVTMAAETVNYNYIVDVYNTLLRAKNSLNTLKTTTGIAQYAKDQESDQLYDVVAEFVTLLADIDSAITWLETNIPANITANNPADWLNTGIISTSFTPAQTSGLRTQLNSVIAEII